MKKPTMLILLIAGVLSFLTFCKKTPEMIQEDPIATIGHGSVIDKSGKPIKLDETFIRKIQDLYIRNLSIDNLPVREGSVYDKQKTDRARTLIYDKVDNEILANAIYIDWLIEQRKPQEEAQYVTVNSALRWYYVQNIQQNGIMPNAKNEWWKGVTPEEGKDLEEGGVIVYAITNSGMQAYCEECLEAGVPVPANMFGPEWRNLGSFENEFIGEESGPSQPELMIYVSRDPEGFCLALPRYPQTDEGEATDRATLFGVICMGTRTSKVCFFDNPNGTFYQRDVQINFRASFKGGTDLPANGQGTCTDCHAGENPYVVHPDKQPFENMRQLLRDRDQPYWPRTWHDPLVVGTWPQNPGPTYILDAITEGRSCNGCHSNGGSGGRFPDMSYPLPGYCTAILNNAVRPAAAFGTMPRPGFGVVSDYTPQVNALQAYCSGGRTGVPPVITGDIPADPRFLSPPLIVGPVYACATKVAVRGVVLDAKATLFTKNDPVPLATIDPARSPFQMDFTCRRELVAGDSLYAIQEAGGARSATSPAVIVKNYRDDYPTGLPTPQIDPNTVYACASLIAVRHLQGAIITVVTNNDRASARSFTAGGEWTSIPPSGAPFRRGDQFKVVVSMCGDVSDTSVMVVARDGPATLVTPTFRPPNVFTGQELLYIESIEYGSTVSLRNAIAAWTGTFSTPVTWLPDYDLKKNMGRAIQPGDNIVASQKLCDVESEPTPGGTKTQGCEGLPAPRIERPLAGRNFVIVADAIPGARIRVYDNANTEIGDGSGRVIILSRNIVPGERLRVVQQVGECTSRFIYQTVATSGN